MILLFLGNNGGDVCNDLFGSASSFTGPTRSGSKGLTSPRLNDSHNA